MSRIGSSQICTPPAVLVTKERGSSSRRERFGWQNGDERSAPRDGALVAGRDGLHAPIDPRAVEARLAQRVADWVPYVSGDIALPKAKQTNGSGGPLADVLTGAERKGYARPVMVETGRPVRLVSDGDDMLPALSTITVTAPAPVKGAGNASRTPSRTAPAVPLGDAVTVLEDRVATVLATLKVANTPRNRAAALDYLAALDAGLVKVSE